MNDPLVTHDSGLAELGELLHDVQTQQVFADGKTFVDCRPRQPPAELRTLYLQQRTQPGFVLQDFIARHFELPGQGPAPELPEGEAIAARIDRLWGLLARRADPATPDTAGSLIPLPHPYVVPGGRFREVYYWDSYFTMQGLVAAGRGELARSMLDNFAHLLDRLGFIPNSNRRYMLSRSQPPFFFKMVELLHADDVPAGHARYLPQLLAEHAFWMSGQLAAPATGGHQRVALLPDGSMLNRYWDALAEPRPESYREDLELAARAATPAAELYRHLRAAAESGWDFSSRWCADPQRLETIETCAVVPVDLNSLMWGLERAIAGGAAHLGDQALASRFEALAERRRQALLAHCWCPAEAAFLDLDLATGQRRPVLSAAAFVPLYLGLATPAQAQAFAATAEARLLAPSGIRTTGLTTGQQWDRPNGWAPLQMMAAEGLRRYGHERLALEIARRWHRCVAQEYRRSGRLLEKYDIENDRPGGGGEYPTQDGFGWTNASHVVFSAWLDHA